MKRVHIVFFFQASVHERVKASLPLVVVMVVAVVAVAAMPVVARSVEQCKYDRGLLKNKY